MLCCARGAAAVDTQQHTNIFCEDVPSTDLVFRTGPVGIAELGFFPHERPRARPSATCPARSTSPSISCRLRPLRWFTAVDGRHGFCSKLQLALCCEHFGAHCKNAHAYDFRQRFSQPANLQIQLPRKLARMSFAGDPLSRQICKFNSQKQNKKSKFKMKGKVEKTFET